MLPYAFFQGKIVPLSEAKIGVMTHAFNYGTAVFEGIRGNWNAEHEQTYLFRMADHYRRLAKSCRVLKIDLRYSLEDMCRHTVEIVQRSGFREDIYVRPLAYKSSEAVGVRLHNLESDFLIFVTPFGNYLDSDKGIHCATSSWRRIDDSMIPARAKVTGGYVNSALAKTEAQESGYDEAIMLTFDGHVAEGSGENLFIIAKGKLITPPESDDILVGITRDTVIQLAREEFGVETVERSIDRSELYLADECFLTGTAAHVTPVLSVDHRAIGTGQVGKLSKSIQNLYFDIVTGKVKKYQDWLTPIQAKLVKA